MAKNLSLARAGRSVEDFYTPIHRRMTEDAATRDVRPSAVEFANALDGWRLAANAIALDAGCGGTVTFAAECAGRGFQTVCGLDVSRGNLEHAKALIAASPDRPAIALCQASVLDLPFEDSMFDLVVCSGVAHHTPDPRRAVHEVARVLKPGGRLYLSLYCFSGSIFEAAVRVWRAVGRVVPFSLLHRLLGRIPAVNNFVLDHMYVPLLWLFTADEIRQWLADEGLAVTEDHISELDPFRQSGRLGRLISGDGLMRVWLCEKP